MVTTDTPTAIGYKYGLVTLKLRPKAAIINENSPICDILMPACMACLRPLPASIEPMVTLTDLPMITTPVMHKTGNQCCTNNAGSINIPTDTKNTAPNKSLTDCTRCSIFSARVVSARIEPMIKAPRAAENPAFVARTTIKKQRPRATTKSVSSLKNFLPAFKAEGSEKMPAMNQRHRKKNSFKIESSN